MARKAVDVHPAEPELHALLDGELDAEARRRVERHLASCPACARRLAGAQDLFMQIASLPELTLGRDLSRPVLRSLRRERRPMPVLGLLGLQSLAAVALIWAVRDQLPRLLSPLTQIDLPGRLIAAWSSLIGALLTMRLPATGLRTDSVAWLPRLGADLPDFGIAPDWILWGSLALGAWLLVNSLVVRAERARRPNGS